MSRVGSRWKGRRAGIAVAVCALAGGASARDAEIEQSAPPVVVADEAPQSQPEDPTAFTTVIPVDAFAGEDRQVEDLLENVPGVFVRRFGGPGERSEVSIRGSSGAQVVVLLDGVRLNSAQSGTVDLSTIPLDLIERIEVSRGGGSVQAGSDAIGGVVNLVTKRASARPETRVSAGVGPFDTWSGAATQTGRLGPLEALLGYDVFKTSGDWDFEPLATGIPDDNDSVERINNRAERHAGLLKLGGDWGDRVRIELSDQLFHASEGVPGLDDASGGALRGQSPTGHLRRTRNVAQLRGLYAVGDARAELRAFHRWERIHFRDAPPGTPFDPPVETDDRTASLGGRAGVSDRYGWGPFAVAPSLGAELRRDTLDPLGTGFRDRRVLGVFLQSALSLWDERVVLVPALRFDETQGFGSEWLPRVGLFVRPLPWLELRANAERSYRVPNFDELFVDVGPIRGNPSLRPERADDFDAGGRIAFGPVGFVRSISLEAAWFLNEIDNTIVFQPVNPDVVLATNIPDARVRGVEVAARVDLSSWLAVSGSWTHLDTEIRRTGSPLPGRPDDEVDARVELRPVAGLKLVGELHHRDRVPANEGGSLVLNARTTFDARLAFEVQRHLDLRAWTGLSGLILSVIGTNLTDRALRDTLFFPQPGRIVMFRLEAWR